jgi:CheY-like chemotaxis protein
MSQPKGRLAGRHIVLVDDQDESRDIVRQLLEDEAARVTGTGSADTAILLMYAETVDVVVTDVSLRGAAHDGLWLLREIRGVDRLRRIPVIGMTRHKERAGELRQLGFAAVLFKPIEAMDLGALIIGCLRK